MSEGNTPLLSVILITPDNYETLRKTIDALRAQTMSQCIELIIVTAEPEALNPDAEALTSFHSMKTVEIENLYALDKAKAAGIRRAGAPVIAFMEEHVYADPHWAEAIIQAHEQPWAVVGPAVRNAEPHTLISWGDFIITYGQWMEPIPETPPTILPGHNSSYKRQVLMDYGDRLEAMLEVEAMMHVDLVSLGHQITTESRAVIYHLGFHKLFASLPVQFHIGRLFAADRSKSWSFIKRLVFTLGSPLIPPLRLLRLTLRLIRSGEQRQCPYAALPFGLPGLISSGLGEMAGYALGPGDSKKKMIIHEFHRDQY